MQTLLYDQSIIQIHTSLFRIQTVFVLTLTVLFILFAAFAAFAAAVVVAVFFVLFGFVVR